MSKRKDGLVQVEEDSESQTPASVIFEAAQASAERSAEPEQQEETEKERKIKFRAPNESPALRELRHNEDRQLKDWLEDIAPGAAVRVKVNRKHPTRFKGKDVGGLLATYDTPIDEDFIRDTHGGGDFYLIVQRPNPKGAGWVYAGGRALKIAGDPRLDDVYRDTTDAAAAQPAASDAIANRAFSVLERQLEQSRQTASRPAPGIDTELLRQITQPMQQQIAELSRGNRELQQQLHQRASDMHTQRPPHDEFRDRLIDKFIDGDSARVAAVRAQFESEIRMLKEQSIADQNRLHDRHERDRLSITASHDREIGMLKSSYDIKVAAIETASSTTRSLLEAEVRRLEQSLQKTEAELTALRLRKEKTILEQASEFASIKEALGEITGDDQKEEKGTLEKFLEAAGNNPLVQGLANRLAGDPGAAPQPQPQMQVLQAPRSRPIVGPDGSLYRQLPDGRLAMVRQRPPVGAQAAAARPRPAPAADAPKPAVSLPNISPITIKVAVDYLENAYRNAHEPDAVATSVRSIVPAEIMEAIRQLGVEGFLNDVAKIQAESPLSTQGGRNWARKLGKSLLGQ
jgi:hypothetical protein